MSNQPIPQGFAAFLGDSPERYKEGFLWPAEQWFLREFAESLAQSRFLDIGVGAGRTTESVASLVAQYSGIDISTELVEFCSNKFRSQSNADFKPCDARDLSMYDDNSFDFVFFSYNGIDYVSYEDRKRVIQEVSRVLDDKGHFFFSCHSLHAYPFRQPHPRRLRGILSPIGKAFVQWRELRMQARNRHISPEEAHAQGWARLHDQSSIQNLYILPGKQQDDLESHGFEVVTTLDLSAQAFDYQSPCGDWMIHFLCRRT